MTDPLKSLLIVDDDTVYRQRLAMAMEKRGFAVRQAESVAAGIAAAKSEAPHYAVVDLRLTDGSGLDIVTEIRDLESRGVKFNDYDLPGFKTVGHVCVLGSEKAAWFNDPEGNILCLHEDVVAK